MVKKLLGVKIDDVSETEVLEEVGKWFGKKDEKNYHHIITTVGPEFLVTAQKDQEFKKILNNADLSLPEGFGLQLYCGVKNRIPGVELVLDLCGLAAQKGWTVGLIGNPNTKLAAAKLLEKFPRLKIAFALDNPEADQVLMDYDILRYIIDDTDGVDLLFVGIGHPEQEKFLTRAKSFKMGMGVGGAFDYISEKKPQPPTIFRKIGLEWFWRLATEVYRPGHLGRIAKATIVFPLLLLQDKLRKV